MNDVDAILSTLRFQLKWALEIANIDPDQFRGREVELGSVLTMMQFVATRFIALPVAANDCSFDQQLALVASALNVVPRDAS